ncbi:hypothetical protein ACEPAI_6552 [Sanghuangporus weigelae]
MAPRLSKRQQREQEELLSLASKSPVVEAPSEPEESEDTETDLPASRSKATGFAALAQTEAIGGDEEVEEQETQQKAKKKNKKKKKKDAVRSVASASSTPQSQTPGGKKTKAKSKVKDDIDDDLDKALAELSVKYPDLQHATRMSNSSKGGTRDFVEEQNALLAVSLAHLDSEAEMRKFFGSKVISASKAQERQPRGAKAALKGLKSNLTKPQPTWWSASQREGLSVRTLSENELNDKASRSNIAVHEKSERWWTVEYSKRYRNVTKAFISAVMSGDPERLYRILSKLPWHADTLLQISEVYRHREEHSSAVDFLNRALFTYERSFIGAFAFTAGSNRLDFDHVENRPFYLALSRMVVDLQRRGCSRTAFEFARLLLALDPYTDPHGSLLFLDFLAIRSGMHEWLLSLWDLHDAEAKKEVDPGDTWSRFNVTVLPGWSYARALALWSVEDSKKEDHEASTVALKDAILNFPAVVPLLADKIDVHLPGDLRGHPDFRVHVDASSLSRHESLVHLLSHLYAYRSSSLWKVPEKSMWLKETALSILQTYHPKKSNDSMRGRFLNLFGTESSDLVRSDLARSIYRHIGALADANTTRRLTAFFPREILNAPSLSCDPLPPLTAVSRYDDAFFAECEDVFAFRPRTRREREIDARNLDRMIPDANVRLQLQAIYDARPDIQRQFPEGVAQFAQVAAQLGEDFWDNLLPQIIGDIGGGRGGMPGEFDVGGVLDAESDDDEGEPRNLDEAPAQNHDEELRGGDDNAEGLEEEEESSDEEETPQAFPLRIWQNLVNRFWGGTAPPPDNDDANANR